MKQLLLITTFTFTIISSFAQGLQCTGGLSWGTQIGQTGYDLSTNGSSTNRIVRNADRSLSVVWIDHYDELTTGNTPKSILGFGYNHYDPTSGWTGGTGTGSGECWEERNGCASAYVECPEIINTGAGKEIVLTHHLGSANKGNSITTRAQYGTGGSNGWDSTVFTGIDTIFDVTAGANNYGGSFSRAVNVNETIHSLLGFVGAGNPYIPVRDINGVNDPIRYYRSQDAGVTWDIINYDFSGLVDSTDIENMGMEGYAIHANGNTVAITLGAGINNDWLLLKSIDGGDTWNKILIQDNHVSDTSFITQNGNRGLVTNNNDFEIIIDDNGTVHTFSGMKWYIDNDSIYRPSGEEYRQLGCGMLYWKEGMTSADTIAFPDYASNPLGNDTVYNVKQQPYYGHYYLGMPTASVDSCGNLFLIYSVVNENSISYINPDQTTDTSGFHDLYMIYSLDNGSTWGKGLGWNWINNESINLAEEMYGLLGGTPTQDDLFPNTVPKIAADGILHLVWQGDWNMPGLALRSDTYPHANGNCNYITYTGLDVSYITGCLSVPNSIENIFDVNLSINPNPSSLYVSIKTSSKINSLVVFDLLGKKNIEINNIENDSYTLNTVDLVEGIYLIKIETENGIGTEKLIIKR